MIDRSKVKSRDGRTVPVAGEVWCVEGFLFEVVEVRPEPGWGVKARLGTFVGRALDESLRGTGFDGGSYAY